MPESVSIELGPLDHIAPTNIPQSMIYLSLKPGIKAADALNCLKEGLERTFLQIPWLSGKVYRRCKGMPRGQQGQLEIRYSPEAVLEPHHLRSTELDTPYEELRELGFPLDSFEEELVLASSPFSPDFDEGANVFTAQANFLPGGCLLALSICSPASDGTAMLTVTKLWAAHCINNTFQSNASPIEYHKSADRSAMDNLLKKERLELMPGRAEWAARQLLALDSEQSFRSTGHEPRGEMKQHLFYMPHAAYTTLVKEARASYQSETITGNDLTCALIWRSFLRAWTAVRANDDTECETPALSELFIPFDARPAFAKFLPDLYLGNMNFENRVAMPLVTIVSPNTSISSLALAMHVRANEAGKSASLLDAYGILCETNDYNKLQIRASHATGASLGILSPIDLPFNSTSFGSRIFGNGGRPDAFRPMMGACNREFRICFVIPRNTHGGLEFVMTLTENEMAFLREDVEFNCYASPIS
ncbi:putative Transferase family protein [Seiridium cardinale]